MWGITAVTVAQNLREDGSLSPEYTNIRQNPFRASIRKSCCIQNKLPLNMLLHKYNLKIMKNASYFISEIN